MIVIEVKRLAIRKEARSLLGLTHLVPTERSKN